MAQHTYSLRKILLDNELQAMPSVARVVLVTEKDILEDIACMHSLAMKACDQKGHKGSEKRTKQVAKKLTRGQPFIRCEPIELPRCNKISSKEADRLELMDATHYIPKINSWW